MCKWISPVGMHICRYMTSCDLYIFLYISGLCSARTQRRSGVYPRGATDKNRSVFDGYVPDVFRVCFSVAAMRVRFCADRDGDCDQVCLERQALCTSWSRVDASRHVCRHLRQWATSDRECRVPGVGSVRRRRWSVVACALIEHVDVSRSARPPLLTVGLADCCSRVLADSSVGRACLTWTREPPACCFRLKRLSSIPGAYSELFSGEQEA